MSHPELETEQRYVDRAYEHLAHHNFVFSHDPEEEFDAIYRQGEPAPDPTCYVAAPARTEPPWRSATARTMESPSPDPGIERDSVER